jgi:hypothetical protein
MVRFCMAPDYHVVFTGVKGAAFSGCARARARPLEKNSGP